MTCSTCERRDAGEFLPGVIHCRRCHQTWTGLEAQHCTVCCHTFTSISSADAHRYRKVNGKSEDRCIDPATTDGWRTKRGDIWTNAATWAPEDVS